MALVDNTKLTYSIYTYSIQCHTQSYKSQSSHTLSNYLYKFEVYCFDDQMWRQLQLERALNRKSTLTRNCVTVIKLSNYKILYQEHYHHNLHLPNSFSFSERRALIKIIRSGPIVTNTVILTLTDGIVSFCSL